MLSVKPAGDKAVAANEHVTATTLKGPPSLWRIVQPQYAADKAAGWVKIQSQNLDKDGKALYLALDKAKTNVVLEADKTPAKGSSDKEGKDLLWKIDNEAAGTLANDFTLENMEAGNTKKLCLGARTSGSFPEVRGNSTMAADPVKAATGSTLAATVALHHAETVFMFKKLE